MTVISGIPETKPRRKQMSVKRSISLNDYEK